MRSQFFMNINKGYTLIVLAAALAGTTPAYRAGASGSYTARPAQPKSDLKTFARAYYSLGQRVFQGKADLDSDGNAPCQAERLQALQDRLPQRVAGEEDLTSLAGGLSSEQLNALELYVIVRFTEGLEKEPYILGQQIIDGEKPPEQKSDVLRQRSRLESLQSRLPECLAGELKLPELAGRLTVQQLEAVQYHLAERFLR
jgi:hypothetical protein